MGLTSDASHVDADYYLITTSFENEGDSYGSFIACSNSEENKIRTHTHNHPNGYMVPSSSFNNGAFLVPYAGIQRGDDQKLADYVQRGSPLCAFSVYVSSKGGQYRPYAIQHNGKILDYTPIQSNVSKKGGQYVIK